MDVRNTPLEAQAILLNHINEQVATGHRVGPSLILADTRVVWFCYILGGWKALITTTLRDGMYYEVTYSVEKDEIYIDSYRKVQNHVIHNTPKDI